MGVAYSFSLKLLYVASSVSAVPVSCTNVHSSLALNLTSDYTPRWDRLALELVIYKLALPLTEPLDKPPID